MSLSFEDSIHSKNKKLDFVYNNLGSINNNLVSYAMQIDGLKVSIENLLHENPFKIRFPINYKINYAPNTLSYQNELLLYHIIKESLSNISKHANASSIEILIDASNENLYVEIIDNGKGFPLKQILQTGNAFGLKKIMDNCNLLKTSAFINSSEKGTKISFHIPLKNGI